MIPGKVILKTLVGSHSYGTNVEGSDRDYKGIYVQDPKHMFRYGYVPQIDVTKDEVYFELGRFIELCASNNPTVLELLYPPKECVQYADETYNKLVSVRDQFLSKKCKYSFGGYAISQIKKAGGLDKKMNWEKERMIRKDVLDFMWAYPIESTSTYVSDAVPLKKYLLDHQLEQEHTGLVKVEHFRQSYLLFWDSQRWLKSTNPRFCHITDHSFRGIIEEDSNEPRVSSVPTYMTPRALVYFNKDAYSIHCSEYKEYEEWLNKRNTQRYVDINEHGQKIDGKNLLHCVRLIDTAIEIAETGTINVRRPNKDYLIEIRQGKHDLQSILSRCEKDLIKIDETFDKCNLPDIVSPVFIDNLLTELRNELYIELG